MPSGPKKRHAARRRSMGRPGTWTPLDKASVSDSHVSDEGTTPKTSDDKGSRLSLPTGSNERPADQTFQTEEWVRVSDFDVGTPTSTTAKDEFDAQDSIGDVRGHDKLVDWETVSRENAGNSSSAEEVGEADHLAVEDSSDSGRKQGQKLPHVDVVLSGSDSEKEDDNKSVSSRSVGGKSSLSSTSSSSRSGGSRSDVYPKKSDDEERSSSIVVVPSYREHEDDSQESSYAEVASVEAREDDDHLSVANVSSPEGKEVDYQVRSAIEPASSEEQEEDNYEVFSGVEDHASSAIEPASSEEHEEEKYRLFTDVSNAKDLEDVLSGIDAVDLTSLIRPQGGEGSSSNESVLVGAVDHHSWEAEEAGNEEPKVKEEEHQTTGHLKTEDDQVPELTEMKPETPEVKKSSLEVINSATSEPYPQSLPEIHPLERNIGEGGSPAQEFTHDIEPTTPEKTSEKSVTESPYAFVRSVSDKEVLEGAKTIPSEVEQSAPTPSLSEAQGGEENVAKEVHDSSISSGLPEPNQEGLKQLIEIAHSKRIADLGKQEEKLLAQVDQELGKGIVEPQPLVDVLSATDPSRSMEGGELKDFEPVVAGEAPLLKDSSSPVDSDLHETTALKDRVPEVFTVKSVKKLPEVSQGAGQDDHQTADSSLMDDSVSADLSLQTKSPLVGESAEEEKRLDKKAGPDSFHAVDHAHSVKSEEIPSENVKGALVPLATITDSEWPKYSAESTKAVEATSEAEKVYRSGKIAGSSEKHEQVTHQIREDQPRILGPIQASSDTWGCCEPLQWLFANFRRWVNPPAIRN